MSRILILEKERQNKPQGYDHVFSFTLNNADSFPESYIHEGEANRISDEVYEEFSKFLNASFLKTSLQYRGVDLLWCFKKRLLNTIFFSELQYQVFKKVWLQHETPEVVLERHSHDPAHPYLDFILEASAQRSRIQLVFSEDLLPSEEKEKGRGKKRIRFSGWKSLWPARIQRKISTGAQIVVFSDFNKSKSVLQELGSNKYLIYTDTKSPRLFQEAFKRNSGFVQAEFGNKHQFTYRKNAQKIVDSYSADIFDSLPSLDLEWKKILDSRLKELFSKELPKLLFDIDQIHSLFESNPSLQSALLDEDIAPAKNAFCQVARKFEVTSYVACHGAPGKQGSFLPLTADSIFAWGEAQRQKLIQWGCEPHRVSISGCSRYSEYQRSDASKVREKVCSELGLDPKKRIFLVGFMISRSFRRRIFEHKRREILTRLLEAIAKVPELQCIIKAKNSFDANKKYCSDWIQKKNLSSRIAVTDRFNTLQLSMATDAIFVHNSTFGVDAYPSGKPVVSLFDQYNHIGEEFRAKGAFQVVEDYKELERVVCRLAENPNWKPENDKEVRELCLHEGSERPEEVIAAHLVSTGSRDS